MAFALVDDRGVREAHRELRACEANAGSADWSVGRNWRKESDFIGAISEGILAGHEMSVTRESVPSSNR